jgi:hypothetical protein
MKNFLRLILAVFFAFLLSLGNANSNIGPPLGQNTSGGGESKADSGGEKTNDSAGGAKAPDQIAVVSSGTFYSPTFNTLLWVAGVLVGGFGSFALFIWMQKKASIKGDWLWPIIPATFAGFLFVMLPIWIPNPIVSYGDWGTTCFSSETYAGESSAVDRNPDSGSEAKRKCNLAQTGQNSPGQGNTLSHNGLFLNSAFEHYKASFSGGLGNVMFPNEMQLVIWLLNALYGNSIYFSCILLRRRFFST